MQVSKHMTDSSSWVQLTPGLNNQKKRGPENVLAAPYALKDGTFLVVRAPSSQPKSSTPAAATTTAVDRREDMFERYLREVAAEEKPRARQAQRAGMGGGLVAVSNGRRTETEVMLRIGGIDLNFSDDDNDTDDDSA
jgi:hypothetical protein